jgi:stress-induced morphogen
MDPLQEKLGRLFQSRFGRRAKIELESDADGISGKIVSTKFRGLEDLDRVRMVWDTFDGSLSTAEKRQIVIILALTPEETREDSSPGPGQPLADRNCHLP